MRRLLLAFGLSACGCRADVDFLTDPRSVLGLEPNTPAPQYTEDAQARGRRAWQNAEGALVASQQRPAAAEKQQVVQASYMVQEQGGEHMSSAKPRIPAWQPRPVAMEKVAAPEATLDVVVEAPPPEVSQSTSDGGTNTVEPVCEKRCVPPYVHWAEGPPRLWFKCACPRPVCDPCSLEHYGYYATCWRPWSFTTESNHCPAPALPVETGIRGVLPSTGEGQTPLNQGAPGSGAKPR
jgi:hypothetical protein